jgi:tetratricopeptide (TPR) repeat protein
LQRFRKDLLQSALTHYEGFVRDYGDNPQLQAELAATYFRIAQINAEIGTPQGTAATFVRGLDILEKLEPERSNHGRFQSLLVGIYKGRHRLALDELDTLRSIPSGALDTLQRARKIWEKLVDENPDSVGFQNDLAGLHNLIGIVQTAGDLYDDALASFRRARLLWQNLTRDNPENANYRSDLALTYGNAAEVYRRRRQPREALREQREALEIFQQLVREHPEGLSFQHDLAGSFNLVGFLQSATQQPDLAQDSYEQACRILEPLCADYPTVTIYQRDLATVYVNRGDLARQRQDPRRGHGEYQKALAIGQKLLARGPRSEADKYAVLVGTMSARFGDLLAEQGAPKEALEGGYTQAILLLTEVVRRESLNTLEEEFLYRKAAQSLSQAHAGQAQALTQLGHYVDALREWDRAIELDNGQHGAPLRLRRARTSAYLLGILASFLPR